MSAFPQQITKKRKVTGCFNVERSLKFNSCISEFLSNSNTSLASIIGSMHVVKTFILPLQFVADGVFKAELDRYLTKELAEDGYSGVEVRKTPSRTEVIILATRTQNVLGEKGRRIRELTSLVQKRFGYSEGSVEVSYWV